MATILFEPLEEAAADETSLVQLQIVIDSGDPEREVFDQIEVWVSDQATGPFQELTAATHRPARVPETAGDAPTAPVVGASAVLVGYDLDLRLGELEDVTVTFTGSDPLTFAQAAAQVNAQVGTKVRAYVDADGVFVLETMMSGATASLRVLESEGAARLGLPFGDDGFAAGKQARIALKNDTTIYPFADPRGARSFYYRTRLRNRLSGTVGVFSEAFPAAQALGLASSKVVTGFLDLASLDGRPLVDVEVTVYNALLGDRVDGWLIAQTNASKRTDAKGHVSFPLVRGAKVTVAIVGTDIVRDIVVPTDETVSSFALLGDDVGSDDVFTVQVPQLNYAERRSL